MNNLATSTNHSMAAWASAVNAGHRFGMRHSATISRLTLGLTMAATFWAPALAQTGTDPQTMIKNITDFILGPFGQSLAVLGLVGIGLAWMFGRASLGLIAGVIGGIIIMFGASILAGKLTGQGS